MRIDLPVYGRLGGNLHVLKDGACVKNPDGIVIWSCNNDHKINIAACPRSGTTYIAEVLREMGYYIGHEQQGGDGTVGYHLAVIKPENALHQVRHPLKQIASMLAHRNWGFVNEVIQEVDTELYGCMVCWLKINTMCEEFCVWRYQIEELPEVWDEFVERIGHEKCDLPDISTKIHAGKKTKEVTWSDLLACDRQLAHDIMRKAQQYGYELPQGQSSDPESQTTLVA